MPRRDGLPTNIEMLADFTETARQFFVTTFNAVSEAGFHPGFIDKPLSSIYAIDDHLTDTVLDNVLGSIGLESLFVEALGENEVSEPLPGAGQFEMPPAEIIQYRTALRRPVSETRVADGLDVTDIVVPGTVNASYMARDHELNLKRSTDSFDVRPSKINIAAGKFLAEEALKHVTAKGRVAILDDDIDSERALFKILQANALHDISLLEHDVSLGISISTNLPLNGHESPEFLKRFQQAMELGLTLNQSQVEKLEAMQAPAELVDRMREISERKKAAAKRARDILDK